MTLPKTLSALAAVGLFITALIAAENATGQADSEAATVAVLARELQTQQTALLENHAKIDAKIAVIEEELRQARIYVSRGGKL